jgi:hypothetical protein
MRQKKFQKSLPFLLTFAFYRYIFVLSLKPINSNMKNGKSPSAEFVTRMHDLSDERVALKRKYIESVAKLVRDHGGTLPGKFFTDEENGYNLILSGDSVICRSDSDGYEIEMEDMGFQFVIALVDDVYNQLFFNQR